jgi:perosamine synthetase
MKIPMSSPDINEADKKAVMEVLDSGWLSMGSKVKEFEDAFADYIGVKYAIAVSNGTCGLHLACKIFSSFAFGNIITSPFSFVASTNMIPKPSFVDIDETLNIAPELIAPIPVLAIDVFGQPYDKDRIHIVTIEDACEALGSEYKGRKAGTLGDISVFAFYPNKQITTGEGGMICTDNKEWAMLCRSWRNQGRGEGDDWFNHVRIGYNYRMDEMSAALGLSQLSRIEELLQKREQVADWYSTRLESHVQIPYISPNTTRMSWFVYVIQVDERDDIAAYLATQGIPTRNYFQPIHLMPMYGYERGSFPIAERAGDRCLALPFSSVMTEEQVDYVCKEIIND